MNCIKKADAKEAGSACREAASLMDSGCVYEPCGRGSLAADCPCGFYKKTASKKKYLDIWTGRIIGAPHLSRELLDSYTEQKLRDVLEYVHENSVFYRRLFDSDEGYRNLCNLKGKSFFEAFGRLPMSCADDLRKQALDFLCVRPADISRIVTLDTGGTTGKPKRIYFTAEDQQLTVDYFENGMQLIADENDCVMILMPAQIPGSIGRLLSKGLRNFGAGVIEYGLPDINPENPCENSMAEIEQIITIMIREKVSSVVALPTHLRAVAEAAAGRVRLKSVLLSAEYVSEEDTKFISSQLGCRVYEHYGMTEMGLGCAVSCGRGRGYHIREADLYLEIIDPNTGCVITDDTPGEIVFTTLTRKGMPFVRYRTGDISSWIKEPCECGSILKRLARVNDRKLTKGYLKQGV